MEFEEYKKSLIDTIGVQNFEYKSTGGWINHHTRLPQILVGLGNCKDKTIKIPAHIYNRSGEFVGVNGIEEGVLGENSKLTNLIFPNNFCLKIRPKTFAGCKNLQTLVLPKDINSIPKDAFKDCKKLKFVYFQGSQEEWEAIEIEDTEYTIGKGLGLHANVRAKHLSGNDNLLNAKVYYNCEFEDYVNADWENYLKQCEQKINSMRENFPTKNETIDKSLDGGFKKKNVYVIASRQGEGKTTFMFNLAKTYANSGAMVSYAHFNSKDKRALSGKNINYYTCIEGLSLKDWCKKEKDENGLDALFIDSYQDYLENDKKDLNYLYNIAKKLDIIVILSSKLGDNDKKSYTINDLGIEDDMIFVRGAVVIQKDGEDFSLGIINNRISKRCYCVTKVSSDGKEVLRDTSEND